MKIIVSMLALAMALVLPAVGGNFARAADKKLNACGCYGEANNCICTRKAKCGCPGECEPKGCEESRQKKLQKEIDEETKKAKAAEEAARKSKEPQAEEENKPKAPPAKPMTPVMKKQLVKLIEAYLAEHPEWKNKMLWEVRDELK
jgi:hypothetical protein